MRRKRLDNDAKVRLFDLLVSGRLDTYLSGPKSNNRMWTFADDQVSIRTDDPHKLLEILEKVGRA